MIAEDRYRDDPVFHRLVDMIYHAIAEKQYTATEVRDAAMLAAIHYEHIHLRRFGYLPDEHHNAYADAKIRQDKLDGPKGKDMTTDGMPMEEGK